MYLFSSFKVLITWILLTLMENLFYFRLLNTTVLLFILMC